MSPAFRQSSQGDPGLSSAGVSELVVEEEIEPIEIFALAAQKLYQIEQRVQPKLRTDR
jgi:hypothetical protein